ncbi:MAG: hypothetical protein A2X61_16775 [Ignavibacteria bacterium GWB2_35_12]|nr:MAG: hypothetical protein A2X63_04875 [Ignavibacteria bacterium GWA2_35_8]OGU38009.1 MAG: hypothetical protein A2X61_16775 [Ignavibacteria bacterium GWB2_35_12]OGU89091.1 MAG: hypothetical protein A2220_15285 [Ignavibacteria bacterium RIFOXYA2_FULL_35_10]OGV25070.1 MAG: hypothetical protein A2475_16855 [Ignavibacteria bacterium RIFOXYC2_FULL_35_21]
MKLLIINFIMLCIIIIPTQLDAHSKEVHKKKIEIVKDSSLQTTNADSHSQQMAMGQSHNESESREEIVFPDLLFHHLHNKLVHFPLALSILAFLFTTFSFKWKQFEFSIKYIVLIAAIISIPAIVTGLQQAGNFEGDPKEWLVNIHKWLGILSLVILWIWSGFLWKNSLRKFAWVLALISFIIVTITGLYGGIIAH